MEAVASTQSQPRVNPSSRPVALIGHKHESWTLQCGAETRQVQVEMGEQVTENLTCP